MKKKIKRMVDMEILEGDFAGTSQDGDELAGYNYEEKEK